MVSCPFNKSPSPAAAPLIQRGTDCTATTKHGCIGFGFARDGKVVQLLKPGNFLPHRCSSRCTFADWAKSETIMICLIMQHRPFRRDTAADSAVSIYWLIH